MNEQAAAKGVNEGADCFRETALLHGPNCLVCGPGWVSMATMQPAGDWAHQARRLSRARTRFKRLRFLCTAHVKSLASLARFATLCLAEFFTVAPRALRKSSSALGAYRRRLCARMDRPEAIMATAHKLARLVYLMLTKGQACTDAKQHYDENRYRERAVKSLIKRAHLGCPFSPVPAVAPA